MRFVYDDGGRSRYYKACCVGDCFCRAVSIATGKDYREVYKDINRLCKGTDDSARNGVGKKTMSLLMESYGWKWTPTMVFGQGCKTHLRDGELPDGRIVVRLSKHVTAVIDGVIHDTYDPSRAGKRCVYGYWSRI